MKAALAVSIGLVLLVARAAPSDPGGQSVTFVVPWTSVTAVERAADIDAAVCMSLRKTDRKSETYMSGRKGELYFAPDDDLDAFINAVRGQLA